MKRPSLTHTLGRLGALLAGVCLMPAALPAADVAPRIDGRFQAKTDESPDFRRHVVPLLGKLGCNGRACHGSFQGQGGFQLSLFGYDFENDLKNLTQGDEPRVDLKSVADSLILQKPTMAIPHEGGERLTAGTWQYRVLEQWIRDGAKGVTKETPEFERLEITPSELVAKHKGDEYQLKVVALWSDGRREDVTPLCRFQSNNDQIATITEAGKVTVAGPGDTHVVAFYDNGVVPVPVMLPVSDQVGPNYPKTPTPTKIDQHVVAKLKKLGVVQSDLATDEEFLRRVSLDITGTLPLPREIQEFASDTSADKRAKKIDELLERPEYAAWWATKLADMTNNNPKFLNNQGPMGAAEASRDWYEWLRARVEKNVGYDEIAEGIILAVSRLPDESYEDYCARMSRIYGKDGSVKYADQHAMSYYWSRRNFNTPEDRALGFAYTFLGLRIQCAQCHKHPFDQWTKNDFDQFKNFFSRVRFGETPGAKAVRTEMLAALEIDTDKLKGNQLDRELSGMLKKGKTVPMKEVFVLPPQRVARNNKQAGKDKDKAKKKQVVVGRTARILGGEEYSIDTEEDPRTVLMEWLRDRDNPYFARAFVNRVWAGYFNVGIVEPPDNLSLANPPCNEELLAYLTDGFVDSGYDMKWLHREIANSRTYQLSWRTNPTNRLDDRNFSHAVPRRLPAEVAYDVIRQATASDFELDKWHDSTKGRAIDDSTIAAKGRGPGNYALTVFGRSIRESNCDCDRSMEPSLLQTVFLQNDNEVLTAINRKGGWLDQVVKAGPDAVIDLPGTTDEGRRRRERKREASKQIEKLTAQLKTLDKKKDQREIAQIRRRLTRLQEENGGEKAADFKDGSTRPVDADEVAAIVTSAYLRTLSRLPDEEEQKIGAEYFTTVDDVRSGARDLLWALINTKEFIINH